MNDILGFLSYTHRDDAHFRQRITKLKGLIESWVSVLTGCDDFRIFQDKDGIGLGEQWQESIRGALSSSAFFIPILTPSFFTKDNCRRELEEFLLYESSLGRNDLILPIYYIVVPGLEKQSSVSVDPLMKEIGSRQWFDWRSLAGLSLTDPKVGRMAQQLCENIVAARSRTEAGKGTSAKKSPARKDEQRFSDVAAEVQGETQSSPDSSWKRTLLWVDDTPSNNTFEREALTEYGVRIIISRSTDEALRELSTEHFDAIISDMGRPSDPRAGYTLLEAARRKGFKMPYFIYSGSRFSEHVAEAHRRGAQEATNDPDELIGYVLNYLDL